MLFRYASFKLINPMRVSGHYPCSNQKNEWHCHIRRFPYCFFFFREAKTNFISIEELEMHALN